jgi:hypothetical protein
MRVKIRDPKYAKRHLYGFHISEFYYAEGDVCDSPKWVSYDSLSLRYGPGKYDFRIIDRANIVEIDGNYQTPKPATQREVKVTGKSGKIYTVTVDGNKAICHCTGFSYRKTCSHVQEALVA